MQVNSFEMCSRPKNKDCTIIKPSIIGKNIIYLRFQVTSDCSPSKVIKFILEHFKFRKRSIENNNILILRSILF